MLASEHSQDVSGGEVGGGGHVILRSSIAISSFGPLTAKVMASTTEVLIVPGMYAENVRAFVLSWYEASLRPSTANTCAPG